MYKLADWLTGVYVTNSAGAFSEPFHFIDAHDDPPTSCGVELSRDCGSSGCVVSAIANYVRYVTTWFTSLPNVRLKKANVGERRLSVWKTHLWVLRTGLWLLRCVERNSQYEKWVLLTCFIDGRPCKFSLEYYFMSFCFGAIGYDSKYMNSKRLQNQQHLVGPITSFASFNTSFSLPGPNIPHLQSTQKCQHQLPIISQ